jgi:hypothetical protein
MCTRIALRMRLLFLLKANQVMNKLVHTERSSIQIFSLLIYFLFFILNIQVASSFFFTFNYAICRLSQLKSKFKNNTCFIRE